MKLLIPEFNEADHKYTVHGKPAPGVTTIIGSVLGVNSFWTDAGRNFGTAVHKAIHYYEQQDLDFDSLDDSIKPRLDAYVKFMADNKIRADLTEQPLYRENPVYCGMIDMAEFDRVVIDFKAGEHNPRYGVQLAAYAMMMPNPHLYDRMAVQLKDDGKYDIKQYPRTQLSNDFNVFLSMFNVWNWRKVNGNNI